MTETAPAPVAVDPLKPVIPEVAPPVPGAPGAPAAEESVFVDYFGFEESGEFTFPDGHTKIWFKAMNEGDRARFQRATNKDVSLERQTGNARVKTDPAGERYELIMASVTNWNLHRRNPGSGKLEPVPFSKEGRGSTLAQWIDKANPAIVDKLEEAIRNVNPWLIGDMNLEDIEREIERLTEMKKEKVRIELEKEAFRG